MNRTVLTRKENNEYYDRYIEQIPAGLSLRAGFGSSLEEVVDFFHSIPEEKLEYRYAEGKWSIKEIFQHLIDTERVFAYRMFRIGRGDATPLAGFDQNLYVEPSGADKKSLAELTEEFQLLRKSTQSLLGSLLDEDLQHMGEASGFGVSSRALAFIILGHERWHMKIIRERYL
ncbi:MAG: DinB family protein [Bacteroidota bacterium]